MANVGTKTFNLLGNSRDPGSSNTSISIFSMLSLRTIVSYQSSLLYAAEYGNSDVLKLLINSGADINAKNKKDGSTALIYMVRKGDNDAVNFLLKKGANVSVVNSSGSTALIYVSMLDAPTRKLLIEKSEDADMLNENKITVFMNAAAEGDIDLVKKLIKEDVSPKAEVPDTRQSMPC